MPGRIEDRLHRIVNERSYKRAVSDAAFLVELALLEYGEPAAVAVSGGKDSIAMAGLVAQYCKPLVIFRHSGLELPDSLPTIEKLCETLNLGLHIIKPKHDIFEQLKTMGVEAFNEKASKLGGKLDKEITYDPISKELASLGINLEFVGLRESESKARKMTIRKFGGMHQSKKYGCGICWPLRKWSGKDVLAYIDEHNLPLHPAYSRTTPQLNREDIRISWALWGQGSLRTEEVQYLRQHYPEFYQEIRQHLGGRI